MNVYVSEASECERENKPCNAICWSCIEPRRNREMKCVHGESRIFLTISLFVDFNTDLHFNGWRFVPSPFSLCRSHSALPLTWELVVEHDRIYVLWLKQKLYNKKNHQSLPHCTFERISAMQAGRSHYFFTFVDLITRSDRLPWLWW